MAWVHCRHQPVANVDAIIFDKDGTLADSRPFLRALAVARAWAATKVLGKPDQDMMTHLLDRFGVTPDGLDPDGLMAVGTRRANQDVVIACLVEDGYSAEGAVALTTQLFTAVDTQMTEKTAQTPPFVGTEALLRRLSQGLIRLGVLSSDSPAYVDQFLTAYGLTPWIMAWRGTGTDDPPKPDPTLLIDLCDALGVNVANTLIVGDSWVDLSLAQGAGAAGFLSVSEAWGRPPVAGADLILWSWDDLWVAEPGQSAP
ncbi:MAG: HAD family hydrolase [Nodosilinea sp.]